MAYLNEEEVYEANEASDKEAVLWRKDYPEYERLMDNGLLAILEDDTLPEVNDGSLAASLFKLAKRTIKKKMGGKAIALDRDDQWITELANIEWSKKIFPNAKSKATPRAKWKDAVRKAAGLGGQPIVTLMVNRGTYEGADFIVPYAQDVRLEAGKDSDLDSDILFWDIYYSKLQVRNMFEEALEEMGLIIVTDEAGVESLAPNPKVDPETLDPYNEWNIEDLWSMVKELENSDVGLDEHRPATASSNQEQNGNVKKTGMHFYIAFQRGNGTVDEEGELIPSPFLMCRPGAASGGNTKGSDTWIRRWGNPDPTGDVPIHYLYMYQDFINPYGVGIVKLAGGTQNVLDYFRKIDVLATQIGVRPPRLIAGEEDDVDEESMVLAPDANWYIGGATVTPWNMANGVYAQLPARMSMYQTSLQKMIPLGDTTISGTDSGDPTVSKVPAAVKMQAASLSIDDDDIAENVDECFAAVAKSMINTHFANMQGSDLRKLNKEEREILSKSGIDFPDGSFELEIVWDNSRATFDFEVDPDADVDIDDETALEGELKAYEMIKDDPTIEEDMLKAGKRIDKGELMADIMSKLTRNSDKIVVDVSPEEQEEMANAQTTPQPQTDAAGNPIPVDPNAAPPVDPKTGQPMPPMPDPNQPTPKDMVDAAKFEHQQKVDLSKLELEHRKVDMADKNAQRQAEVRAQTPAPAAPTVDPNAPAPASTPGKLGAEPTPEDLAAEQIQMVMETYNVPAEIAAAMLEAESQGFDPQDIVAYMEEQGLLPKKLTAGKEVVNG